MLTTSRREGFPLQSLEQRGFDAKEESRSCRARLQASDRFVSGWIVKLASGRKQASYCSLLETGRLAERVTQACERLRRCHVCPWHCAIDRLEGDLGFCLVGTKPFVSSYGPHHGEAVPLRGWEGSGTILFAGCNLRCGYCIMRSVSCGRGRKSRLKSWPR